jgi:hypothetical protein
VLQVLNRLPVVDGWWRAGSGRWNAAASAQRKTAQEGSEMDEGVDARIQQVEGPSGPYGVDNWDTQRAGEDTVPDGVRLAHEVVERYRATVRAGVVTDMWEAEGRQSRVFREKRAHARR